MKKILRETEKGIKISGIKDTDAIGIRWNDTNRKTIIVQNSCGKFIGLGNYTNYPSIAHSWARPTKQQYVKDAFDQSETVQAYVFDNTQKLLKWASK